MKAKQLLSICMVQAVAIALLSGCKSPPKQNAVISKNDGSFDINVVVSASEQHAPDATQDVNYSDHFSSTDGTVNFQLNINETVTAANMPVVKVVPRFLSEEDAKHVATILFSNTEFYEAEPGLASNYSQTEIQQKISRWSKYISTAALENLYGVPMNSNVVNTIKSYISSYTELLETAPKLNPHDPCRWTFRKESEYLVPPGEVDRVDMSNDSDEISAQLSVGDIGYRYSAITRNKSDFKLNYITAYPYDGIGPYLIDERIFQAQLCRTTEPTESQILSIKEKASQMLIDMDLGDWSIDQCYVETTYFGDVPEYTINVTAVPIFCGVPAMRQQQLSNLKSDKEYASNYYLPDVIFKFSANGNLVYFSMYSPVETTEVINPNVATMSFDELMQRAKTHLSYSDYYEYGMGNVIDSIDEEINCNVTINEFEYGLIRVKVPNTDDSYYYVPGIVFKGTVTYFGETNGVYLNSPETKTLLALNCVDGSVVATSNG